MSANAASARTRTRSRAEFAPIRDIRFRASYNRAVRAPNIVELFSADAFDPVGIGRLCAGDDPQGAFSFATPAACALTGVTAAQYGHLQPSPAKQYNAVRAVTPT